MPYVSTGSGSKNRGTDIEYLSMVCQISTGALEDISADMAASKVKLPHKWNPGRGENMTGRISGDNKGRLHCDNIRAVGLTGLKKTRASMPLSTAHSRRDHVFS